MMYNLNEINQYYYNFPDEYSRPTEKDILQTEINKIPNNVYPEQYNNSYRSNCLEFWKYITNNEVEDIVEYRYMVSNFGNTWDFETDRPLSIVSSTGNKFYQQITVKLNHGSKPVKLHRIVMMLFCPIENPQLYQVNHIDGSHDNNVLYNLEWCDDSYNRIHSIINGVGTNNFSKQIIMLTPEEIHQIKVLREDNGIQTRDIYFTYMPQLQEKGSYDTFRHLIPKIASGRSKLYSRYYQ